MGDYVLWCHTDCLQLNTSKMKELVIDFGRSRPRPLLVLLEGAEVEAAQSYKYLRLWLDNGLDDTHQPPVQEDTKQVVLPQETTVFQHLQQTAVDVLPVCGCQRPLLHCGDRGNIGNRVKRTEGK